MPVPGAPILAAISVSGPSGRITLGRIGEIAPVLQAAAVRLRDELRSEPGAWTRFRSNPGSRRRGADTGTSAGRRWFRPFLYGSGADQLGLGALRCDP